MKTPPIKQVHVLLAEMSVDMSHDKWVAFLADVEALASTERAIVQAMQEIQAQAVQVRALLAQTQAMTAPSIKEVHALLNKIAIDMSHDKWVAFLADVEALASVERRDAARQGGRVKANKRPTRTQARQKPKPSALYLDILERGLAALGPAAPGPATKRAKRPAKKHPAKKAVTP